MQFWQGLELSGAVAARTRENDKDCGTGGLPSPHPLPIPASHCSLETQIHALLAHLAPSPPRPADLSQTQSGLVPTPTAASSTQSHTTKYYQCGPSQAPSTKHQAPSSTTKPLPVAERHSVL